MRNCTLTIQLRADNINCKTSVILTSSVGGNNDGMHAFEVIQMNCRINNKLACNAQFSSENDKNSDACYVGGPTPALSKGFGMTGRNYLGLSAVLRDGYAAKTIAKMCMFHFPDMSMEDVFRFAIDNDSDLLVEDDGIRKSS